MNRRKSRSGTCALCGTVADLHHSHIIPEFMFGPLYDQKHRFYGVSSIASKPSRLFQKGIREYLLCSKCEQRFSFHEDYARRVFFGDLSNIPTRTATGFLFTGLDYKRLKLFFMSLIWRLGICSNDHFAGADLGPHREELRALLLVDDPSDFLTYPAMVIALTHHRRHLPDLIIRPFLARFDGRHAYAVVITGFLFHFFVSNRPPPEQLWGGFLRPNGEFPLHVGEIQEIPFLRQWLAEVGKAEAARASATPNASG